MENKNTLTDKELDTLVSTLEANKSEDVEKLQNIKQDLKNLDKEIAEAEIESEVVNVIANKETGEIVIAESNDPYKDTDLSISDIVDGKLDERNSENFNENLKNSITSQFELNDADTGELLSVIMRYRAGEAFSVYNALPDAIKRFVNRIAQECGAQRNQYNIIAKSILDQFITDAHIDQEFIDFQKSLEKELEIPSIVDMYSEHIRERMETKILESADRLQEEYPEKAKMLRDISAAFTDTYTFTRMREFLDNNSKARRRIAKDANQYNRFCNNFNYKIKDSQYKINDITSVAKTLNKVLPEDITAEDIKKFVVLFCKQCESLDANNVVDCSFMYYTIKNIIMLDYVEETKTGFSQELITNITNMINYIKEVEAKEAELNPVPPRKKARKK